MASGAMATTRWMVAMPPGLLLCQLLQVALEAASTGQLFRPGQQRGCENHHSDFEQLDQP